LCHYCLPPENENESPPFRRLLPRHKTFRPSRTYRPVLSLLSYFLPPRAPATGLLPASSGGMWPGRRGVFPDLPGAFRQVRRHPPVAMPHRLLLRPVKEFAEPQRLFEERAEPSSVSVLPSSTQSGSCSHAGLGRCNSGWLPTLKGFEAEQPAPSFAPRLLHDAVAFDVIPTPGRAIAGLV